MEIIVRAKRILHHLSGFKEAPDKFLVYLKPGERNIGIYENKNQKGSILVTNMGLHYFFDQTQKFYLEYKMIKSVKISEQKEQANILVIILKDNSIYYLPVDNGSTKFRDIFEFLRFIDRVLYDQEKNKT